MPRSGPANDQVPRCESTCPFRVVQEPGAPKDVGGTSLCLLGSINALCRVRTTSRLTSVYSWRRVTTVVHLTLHYVNCVGSIQALNSRCLERAPQRLLHTELKQSEQILARVQDTISYLANGHFRSARQSPIAKSVARDTQSVRCFGLGEGNSADRPRSLF